MLDGTDEETWCCPHGFNDPKAFTEKKYITFMSTFGTLIVPVSQRFS